MSNSQDKLARLQSRAVWGVASKPLWDIAFETDARRLLAASHVPVPSVFLFDLRVEGRIKLRDSGPIKREFSLLDSCHLLSFASASGDAVRLVADVKPPVLEDERAPDFLRLVLREGEVELEFPERTFGDLARLVVDRVVGLRSDGIAFEISELPLYVGKPLQAAGVVLESDGQGGVWLRLDRVPVSGELQGLLAHLTSMLATAGESRSDGPRWTRVELLRPLLASDLRWSLTENLVPRGLQIAGGLVRVEFSDQPSGGQLSRMSRAHVAGGAVKFTIRPDGSCEMSMDAGKSRPNGADVERPPGTSAGQRNVSYQFVRDGDEQVWMGKGGKADKPDQPPGVTFRVAHGLGERVRDIRGDGEPVQRVFVPHHRGWLQLPIQALDIRPEPNGSQTADSKETPMFSGEWILGTRRPDLPASAVASMPWSWSLRAAGRFHGTWTFASEKQLSGVRMEFGETQTELRGPLWVAVGRTGDEDLLPSLGMATTQFRDLVLLPCDAEDLPRVLFTSGLTIRRAPEALHKDPSSQVELPAASATLETRQFKLTTHSKDAFVDWKRHPSLPAMLAMPLSCAVQRPVRPLASRELQPVEVRTGPLVFDAGAFWPKVEPEPVGEPDIWWPSSTRAPIEWTGPKVNAGFPLVSLSLPGVEWWADRRTEYAACYRIDLPAIDEPMAGATLPEPQPAATAALETPDLSVASEADFVAHFLARHDAWTLARGEEVELLDRKGKLDRWCLFNGYEWKNALITIDSAFDLPAWKLGHIAVGQKIPKLPEFTYVAQGDRALVGPKAVVHLEGNLLRLEDSGDRPDLVGWSIASIKHDGATWDSRGMGRKEVKTGNKLMVRDITVAGVGSFSCCSLLEPLRLHVGERTWHLWFRDLPFAKGIFDPTKLPESVAAKRVLRGCEWRFWPKPDVEQVLELEGVSLTSVTQVAGQVSEVRIKVDVRLNGRTELLARPELKFERTGNELFLTEVTADPEFNLPLPRLSPSGFRLSRLRAEVACDGRALTIKGATFEGFLAGAWREVSMGRRSRGGSPSTTSEGVIGEAWFLEADGQGDQFGWRLHLGVGSNPLADRLSVQLYMRRVASGETNLFQLFGESDVKAPVVTWNWLHGQGSPSGVPWAESESTLVKGLDLRTAGGLAVTAASKGGTVAVSVLPDWEFTPTSGSAVLALVFDRQRSAIGLDSAIFEADLRGQQVELGFHSTFAKADPEQPETGKWTNRMRIVGAWRIRNAIGWPKVIRGKVDDKAAEEKMTFADVGRWHDLVLDFDGQVLDLGSVKPRPDYQSLELTTAMPTWVKVRHVLGRGGGGTVEFAAVAALWLGPADVLGGRLWRRGLEPGISKDFAFSDDLDKVVTGFLDSRLVTALGKSRAQVACLSSLVSMEYEKRRPMVLPGLFVHRESAEDFKKLLSQAHANVRVVEFDRTKLALERAETRTRVRNAIAMAVAAPDAPPAWKLAIARPSSLSDLDATLWSEPHLFAVSQDALKVADPKEMGPLFLRSVIEMDRIYEGQGPKRCLTWLPQKLSEPTKPGIPEKQERLANPGQCKKDPAPPSARDLVHWWVADATREFPPPREPSALPPPRPASDLVLVGREAIVCHADVAKSGVVSPEALASFMEVASQARAGPLVAAYRRTFQPGGTRFDACWVVQRRPVENVVSEMPTIQESDAIRGPARAPQEDVLKPANLAQINLLERRPLQNTALGFSATRQLWKMPRATYPLPPAKPSPTRDPQPAVLGPLVWEVHEEIVHFAAEALGKPVWRQAMERTPSASQLLDELDKTMGWPPAPGNSFVDAAYARQSVQLPWLERQTISARAGVQRQVNDLRLFASVDEPTSADSDAAAMLIQQYRAPRPTALPKNEGEDFDRRPRPSAADAERSAAFLEGMADVVDPLGRARVVVRLLSPPDGVLGPGWSGELRLALLGVDGKPLDAACEYLFRNALRTQRIQFQDFSIPLALHPKEEMGLLLQRAENDPMKPSLHEEAEGELVLEVDRAWPKFELGLCLMRDSEPPPDAPPVRPEHTPEPCSTLRFPVLYRSPRRFPMPFRPHTVFFEDPAYNETLLSETASEKWPPGKSDENDQTGRTNPTGQVEEPILQLISDRRSYHPASPLTLWLDAKMDVGRWCLHFDRIRLDVVQGRFVRTALHHWTLDEFICDNTLIRPQRWELSEFIDADGTPQLLPGDTLVIAIVPEKKDKHEPDATRTGIELPLPITARPDVAPPQSAYALWLHSKGGAEISVPLAGWSPMPDRVELVDPVNDLLTGRVRRVALFRWPLILPALNKDPRVFVQKIDHTGATHCPDSEEEMVPLLPLTSTPVDQPARGRSGKSTSQVPLKESKRASKNGSRKGAKSRKAKG